MKRELCVAYGLLCLLLSVQAQAQLELVLDINQTPNLEQSKPNQFTALGSSVIFAATSDIDGRELWKTNGTPAGTVRVKDIRAGTLGSEPLILGVAGSVAFFSANDGVHGVELWKTDGTDAGTVLVKDIFPGVPSGSPVNGIVHGGKLYFTAQDYDRNFELWMSDGTEAGTVMVRDLKFNTVNPGSGPSKFVSTGSKLFFTANTDALGTELYTTDGTFDGTVVVKDIKTGNGNSSNIQGAVAMGSTLYFAADDGVNGFELWKSDGTAGGTLLVKDIRPGISGGGPGEIVVVGSSLYFAASSGNFNRELWKSDGTEANTVQVKEIRPGTGSFQGSDPFGFKAVGSLVYFFANDGTTGIELWKSDGTDGGTTLVKDLLPGTGFGARVNDPGTAPPMLEALGSTVFFYGTDGTATGGELWKTDGTPGGTVMVKELAAGAASAVVREMKAIGSRLYFAALQTGGGTEPYVSDGSSGGTDVLKDISAATASSQPKHLTATAGKLYFSANDGINGRELWVVDNSGAHMVVAANTSTSDFTIAAVGALNGTAFYGTSTTSGNTDYQLFRSDGTSGGTFRVSQAPPLGGASMIPGADFFRAAGNVLFFAGYTSQQGLEMWRTDGTGAGTFLLKDMMPGPEGVEFNETVTIGNLLYFVADSDAIGSEVWRSDGSVAGTSILRNLGGGWPGAEPYSLCVAGSTLYFGADSPGGNELYKSNGTSAGTVVVKDVNSAGSSFAAPEGALNSSTVLFTAFDNKVENFFLTGHGTELWKSNGTAAGTVLVKDINPGTASSSPFGLVETGPDTYGFGVINGVAYFSADDGVHGRELWKSDGTDAGTVLVKDIIAGVDSSNPASMVVVGTKLYFVVTISGTTQLWTSDGTEGGTLLVDDQVSNISQLKVSGTTLYLVGSKPNVEAELFRLNSVRTAPFFITQSPQGQAPALGAAFTLSAATAGPTPSFQWRKDGVAIPGATKDTYTVAKAAESHQGSYDVLIRSGDYELLSDAAQVNVADSAKITITRQPLPVLAATGSTASFAVGVIGQTPSFQWFKGTVPMGPAADTLAIQPVQMSDAGLYKAKVTNSLGSVFSSSVQLAVADSTDQFVAGKANATLTLTAPVTGTGLGYRWLKNGFALNNGDSSGRISGVTTSKLNIARFGTGDQADYSCLITLGGQSLITGKLKPRVAAIPAITPTASPPTWIISGPVNLLATALFTQSNLSGTPWNAPTSFTITGLPRGMTYNAKTGLITGWPLAGGGGNVTLTIKVGNVAGTMTSTISVTIAIENFPALAKGSFRGLANRSNTSLNDNLGNLVQVDVTGLGSLTGKLYWGTTAYSMITRYVVATPGSLVTTAVVSIPRPGRSALTLDLTVNGGVGTMSGTLTDGTNSTTFSGVSCPWLTTGITPNAATAYAKDYTAALQLLSGQVGNPLYPQGDGYAVANVTKAGAVSGAVRMADGTKATFSTLLGALGEIPLYAGAYTNTGSFHGWSQITSTNGLWDGTDSFYKAQQAPASTTRSYKGGIPLHTLTLIGGVWTKPTPAALLLGVTDTGVAVAPNNAEIQFTRGGIDSSGLAVAGTYDVDFRIKAPASIFVLPATAANTGKLTMSFATLVTGEIKGTFATSDPNPVLSGVKVPRTAEYFGVIVQRLNRGRGHFNLAKLPDSGQTNPLKTEVLGGLMEVRPLP